MLIEIHRPGMGIYDHDNSFTTATVQDKIRRKYHQKWVAQELRPEHQLLATIIRRFLEDIQEGFLEGDQW